MNYRGNRVKVGVIIEQPLRDQLFCAEDQARLNELADVTWTTADRPLTTSFRCMFPTSRKRKG